MICVIALIVFGILGIFSAKYRVIAKEAFDCVFRRVTLRKCESGLDRRLKAQITGNLMRRHPSTGRFIFKHFETISWIFTILLLASLVQSGVSVYNFAAYGNCNGKNSDEFCIFDPLGNRDTFSEEVTQCSIDVDEETELTKPEVGDSAKFGTGETVIIEFGCYSCEYTKRAEETYKQIREDFADEITFVYKNFPILSHNGSYEAAIAAECVRLQDENEFWKYHELLFDHQDEFTTEEFIKLAEQVEIDQEEFSQCLVEEGSKDIVDSDIEQGYESGIYGTPTVFINDEVFVGPQNYRTIARQI